MYFASQVVSQILQHAAGGIVGFMIAYLLSKRERDELTKLLAEEREHRARMEKDSEVRGHQSNVIMNTLAEKGLIQVTRDADGNVKQVHFGGFNFELPGPVTDLRGTASPPPKK